MIALTTEEFIRRAKEIHGDKFDYSKIVYVRSDDKIIIICPIDGEFEQRPRHHLFGNSCPKCTARNTTMRPKSNIEEFIEKAKAVHGNKYDYSNVNYFNSNTKVTIICSIHGEFDQRPGAHLSGYGCINCSIIDKTLTQEEFMQKAQKMHNNKYDYSKVVYLHSQSKITVICPEHGEFKQTPASHLNGNGCSLCMYKNKKLTTEEFIQKATEVHGEKYDYTKSVYTHTRNKIIITCCEHGDFLQIPNSHLSNKSGCPGCNSSKGELAIQDILEKHQIQKEKEYKIPEVADNFEYDFYLPEYNLLIEFQGIQHYKPIEYFGGEDNLEYVQRNDKFKKHNAYIWKYNLKEFDYLQFKHMTTEQFEEFVLNSILKYKKIK